MDSTTNDSSKDIQTNPVAPQASCPGGISAQPEVCRDCSLSLFVEDADAYSPAPCNSTLNELSTTLTLSEEECTALKQRIFRTLNLPFPTDLTDRKAE